MRFALLLSGLLVMSNGICQSYRKVNIGTDIYTFYQLPGAKEKIKKIPHIEVFIAIDHQEEDDTVFIVGVYPDLKKNIEIQVVLGKSFGENLLYNTAKMYEDPYYRNDTIFLVSQMPYHATYVTCRWVWNESTKYFEPIEYVMEDASAEKIMLSDSLLKQGKIAEAINLLSEIEYPTSYMNEYAKGKELMSRAHELAMISFKENKFQQAADYIRDGLTFWTNDLYINFNTEKDFIDYLIDEYGDKWTKDDVKLWLGDYGLFLYKAGLLEKSIEINLYLTTILPEISGPYLQLGDSYYDKGDKIKAKETYKKYYDLMKKLKREKEIPKRVKERMK